MVLAAAASTATKLGEAMQSLLLPNHTGIGGTGRDAPGVPLPLPILLVAAAATAAVACLVLSYLLSRSQKKEKEAGGAAASATTHKQPARTPPMLPGPPVLANTVEVLANLDRFLEWIHDCTRRPELGGPDGLGTWGFNVALQPPFVVVHNPECVRHILTQVDRYGKGPVWRTNFWPILGDGIFSADFDNWLTQRKRAANMFKVANFKHSMLEAVRGKLVRFLGLLKEKVEAEDDKSTARPSAVVEMQELFFKLTLDTIGEIAFGRDLGSLDGKNLEFMRAFDFCQQYSNSLFFKPGPGWLWGLATPEGRENARHARVLSAYGRQLVKEMVQEQAAALDAQAKAAEAEAEADGEAAAKAVAQAAMDGATGTGTPPALAREKETILSFFLAKESRASLQDPRTVKYLTDVIMNFQIAGRDTVAQAFSWAVHLLALHPSVQAKLRAEARAVLGPLSQATGPAATYERIQRLEYGFAVVTEVLRLFPSVPKEAKWAYRDDVLPDGTRVQARSWVVFAPYVMGRLEALWSDPEAFKPERHLDKPRPSPFIFTAFQGGPRICLGQNLAYMQLQYGLALLLLAFDLEAVDGGKGVAMVQKSPTLPMRDGVRVRLTLRREDDDKGDKDE